MRQRAAVVVLVMGLAAAAFAADDAKSADAASSNASGFHVSNAVWVNDLPAAPSTAASATASSTLASAPASAPAAAPEKPGIAAKSERGFVPMLHSALVPEHTSVRQQREWMALSMMAHGAAAFDAYSTRVSLESGRGYERNPLMRPFASSGAVYPAAQVLPFGLDYLSRRMMRSNNTVLRHTWFIPQLAATVGSTWVGVRNLHVAQ